jgi:hypothetical protein
MGNVEIDQAIRSVAPLLGGVASESRKSDEAAELAHLIRTGQITDPDDLETLAKLISGWLNRHRGGRGPQHKRLNEAEREARAYAKANGVSLDKAAEAVAGGYGLESETVINKLRRARRPSRQ